MNKIKQLYKRRVRESSTANPGKKWQSTFRVCGSESITSGPFILCAL